MNTNANLQATPSWGVIKLWLMMAAVMLSVGASVVKEFSALLGW